MNDSEHTRKSNIVHTNCRQCGRNMSRHIYHLRKIKHGPFCDRRCLGLFRSNKLTGTNGANFVYGIKRDKKYILVQANWHPYANKNGYIYLHRVLIESKIGRYLVRDELVHHIDGNPENNHWSNLEITTRRGHAKIHAEEMKRRQYGKNYPHLRHTKGHTA